MTDRFKIRCWDTLNKQMHTPLEMRFFKDGTLADLRSSENNTLICLTTNSILMQCTGLKDKHHKLIFEGDIIHNEWLVSDERGDIGGLYVVKFGNHLTSNDYYASAAYGWYGEDIKGGFEPEYSLAQLSGSLIIMGNIYENPELLRTQE